MLILPKICGIFVNIYFLLIEIVDGENVKVMCLISSAFIQTLQF